MQQKQYYLETMNPTNINMKVLHNYLLQDFERIELLPRFVLKRNLKKGVMKAVYLTDGQEKYGYAIYQQVDAFDGIFISYLAVHSKYRAKGMGSELMHQLKNLSANGILLEVEDPEKAKGEQDYTNRLRRIQFYERNGLHINPNIKLNSFFVPLRMMNNVDRIDDYDITFYQQLYNRIWRWPLGNFLVREYK
ncbi:GNAT family N-acetyltransferase [Oceanobacillus timonensis]|uniref:GNAT family N-acetyltransferase n=1 Tax=Oceanobacillus timonensis TaxID=1926285 RepID=UPI0009B93DE5|nr:GNAT family N-acetyltransferase [Oceanobacillus timonensis]